MSWNQKIKHSARKNRFKGGLILSLTVFLSLSLFSYNPQDPSLNVFGLSLKVTNYCGFAGASLADIFYQFFGFSAWFFVLAGLLFSYKFFINRFQDTLLNTTLLFGLFLLSFASLSELHLPQINFFSEQVSLGGALGEIIVSSLKPLFHIIGTAVILWSVFFLVFICYGQTLFFNSFLSAPKKFIVFSNWLIKRVPALWPFVFFKIKSFNSIVFYLLKKIPVLKKKFHKHSSLKIESSAKAEPEFIFKDKEFLETEKNEKNFSQKESSLMTENKETQNPTKEKQTAKPSSLQTASSFSQPPSIDILSETPSPSKNINQKDVEDLSKKLIDKLFQFSIKGEIAAVKTGPAVVLFEFKPEDHIKVSRIREMESDLSLALSSESVRIIAPIPGRDVVGIEASRPYREMVYLKSLLQNEGFLKSSLPLILGRRADNAIGIKDLARIPHLLVAGTTGSGKSIFIISFITSLLFRHTPDTLKILLIDPKQVDLSCFKDIPHLLSPIITASQKTAGALQWAIMEMEKRYRSLALFSARDLKSFNETVKSLNDKEKQVHKEKNETAPLRDSYYFDPLPLICIVIEEFGDLMADRNIRRAIENSVVRLAQKARACGMHLVLAMQSPRKDVVTGLIKTNIPGRISFKVASGTDSRVILDETGAEKLLSHGDMLFLEPGTPKPFRYHGPFIRDKDVREVVNYWKTQGEPLYEEALIKGIERDSPMNPSSNEEELDIKSDPMYNEILDFVKTCDVVSASYLQRKFRIGYPRAARIIEILFEEGQIGPPQGSKAREVLINK